jgi:frataxin-like iron-binding protein CyaY
LHNIIYENSNEYKNCINSTIHKFNVKLNNFTKFCDINIKILTDNVLNEKYKTLTLSWGSSGLINQILPLHSMFLAKKIGNVNKILSFDKLEEIGFGQGYTKPAVIKKYLLKHFTGADININEFTCKLIENFNVHNTFIEKYASLVDSLESDYKDYEDDFWVNFESNISEGAFNIYTLQRIDFIKSILTDIKKTNKKYLAQCTMQDNWSLHKQHISITTRDNITTIFIIYCIKEDLYVHDINRLLQSQINVDLICSVRKVDCLLSYESIDLTNVDNIYTSHGDKNNIYMLHTKSDTLGNVEKPWTTDKGVTTSVDEIMNNIHSIV